MSDRTIPPPGPFNNPAWVFGYVPTAIEWNNWFSRKADGIVGAPGTVTQVDTTAPGITGGPITMHGALAVQWNAGQADTLGSGLVLTSGTLTISYAATGTTTLRTAADRANDDQINVRDYGVQLNGVHNDHTALQAAYTAATTVAGVGMPSIWVPRGGINFGGGIFTPAIAGTNALWKLDGNNSGTTTSPITYVGDGDLTESYLGGRRSFRKRLTNSTNGYANVEIVLAQNNTGNGNGAFSGLVAVASAGLGVVSGWTFPITATSTRSIASPAYTSQINLQTVDYSGLPPDPAQIDFGARLIFRANGPDLPATSYNPGIGARRPLFIATDATQTTHLWQPTTVYSGLDVAVPSVDNGFHYLCTVGGTSGLTEPVWPLLEGVSIVDGTVTWVCHQPYIIRSWLSSHSYAVGTSTQPTVENGFTYVCTSPGTSGTVEPTWPLVPGTVTDGGVTWTYGTTEAQQVGAAIIVTNYSPGDQFGAALYTNATFYDAVLELSGATLADGGVKDAAIRIRADQPIDLSGNLTDAGQNLHTLVYRSSNQRLYYRVAGVDMWSVDASGNVRARGTITGSTTP